MAKTTTKLLGLALAGAGVYGLWSAGQCLLSDDDAQSTRHVINQVWIERIPDGPRDMIGHLVLLDLPEGRMGGAGKSSQWRHVLELFQYGLEGHNLQMYFPQDRVKARVRVRSWRCEGEAPEPFELCLEISSGRRSTTFYSLDEWKIDPDRVQASLEEMKAEHPELLGELPAVSTPVMLSAEELESFEAEGSVELFE